MFCALFALTGIGNGSTFMQSAGHLPHPLKRMAKPGDAAQKQTAADATKEAAAVLGFSGAIGAYGGFSSQSYGTSIALTGGVEAALYAFIAFYLSCLLINGWYYARKRRGALLSAAPGNTGLVIRPPRGWAVSLNLSTQALRRRPRAPFFSNGRSAWSVRQLSPPPPDNHHAW